jgi:quercetin dioxygenase-like cupin family protein
MTEPKSYIVRPDQRSRHNIFLGVDIETVAGDQLMLSLVTFEADSVVEEHSHPHEQAGMLLSGELTFTIGGETTVARAGDMWRIPGNVPHRVVAHNGPATALDVFNPIREDYR